MGAASERTDQTTQRDDLPPEAVERAEAAPRPTNADETSERPQTEAQADEVVEELEARLRRALADLENVRRRSQRELGQQREAERARVASAWLPVVDDLERALQHETADTTGVLDGLRAVLARALSVLAQLGFPRFEDVGERFDPHRHEAISAVDGEPPGTIMAVVQPGYGTDETILRPARVVVARAPV